MSKTKEKPSVDVEEVEDEFIFSHTQLSMAMTCLMKYRHYYVRRISPLGRKIYFDIGTCVHLFLENWYQTRNREVSVRAALSFWETEEMKQAISQMGSEESKKWSQGQAIALGMIGAYPDYFTDDFTQFKTFMPEKDHKIFIHNQRGAGKIYYRAIIDTLVEDAAGDWWVMEHKTPGRVDDDYLRRVRIDWQVLGQMHVAKDILGHWPRGVIYNVMKKPALRFKSGESVPAFCGRIAKEYNTRSIIDSKSYFVREHIIIGKKTLDTWLSNATEIMQSLALKRAYRSRSWPMNTTACTAYNSSCAYLEACISGQYNRLMFTKRKKGER